MTQPIRVCLINRNYPPEIGATGQYAKTLVDYLNSRLDIIVTVITVGIHQDQESITYVRGLYKGPTKWRRMISALLEGFRLILKARRKRADFYIVMTDPSFLNFWASLLLRKDRWALWTMDLYPEAFVSSKSISRKNLAYKIYQKALRKYQPDLLISLGSAQRNYLKEEYYPQVFSLVAPIGISEIDPSAKEIIEPFWADNSKIIFGYIGTIGEAHDADMLIYLGTSLDPAKHRLILSCSGLKADLVAYTLKDLPSVHILDYVETPHMQLVDIHVVTLLKSWTDVCIPSKALTAIGAGGAVLFVGDEKSDTWQYVKGAGWRISDDLTITSFLAELNLEVLANKKKEALIIGKELSEKARMSYEQIETNIRNITSTK